PKLLGSNLYFRATNGVDGVELWKTDGTSAGTVMIDDINPAGDSNPSSFTLSNGIIYFTADDGTNGVELWQTDGTSVGTTIVANINPTGSSNPNYLSNINNVLLFGADDGTYGLELWTIDGSLITSNQFASNELTKQVMPNPTVGEVTITGVKETETLSIYNSVGTLINTYHGHETVSVDLSGQSNGVYIMRSSEGGFLKIVKQ
ncbi:MAG: T9SS type A sorting domain-containing protein, partial [Cytophagaceae bacterium]|nr:T9SS type A sorting domain-containing protein [Cytophagaceae bacterium]